MADNHDLAPIEAAGLRVVFEPRVQVASLRYFDRQGAFARLVHDVTGVTLPDCLRALGRPADRTPEAIVLAWRSPTETLMIGAAPTLIGTLQRAATTLTDGCIVDQSGGALVFRARGEAVAELFTRLGGQGAGPAIGESRRTRLADVAVLAAKVQPEETLLIVERCYAPHLIGAIRISAADLSIPSFGR
jgi:heterotetrameric sarcosine oxidase gamma subunit